LHNNNSQLNRKTQTCHQWKFSFLDQYWDDPQHWDKNQLKACVFL
jgi:hypothetical protein